MGDGYLDPDSTRAGIRRWLRNKYIQNTAHPNVNLGGDLVVRNLLHGPMRMWAETKAWDRGLDSYLRGSAMRGDKWDDIKDTVRKWSIERDPALYSYGLGYAEDMVGDTIGAAGGVAGYQGAKRLISPRLPGKRFLRSKRGLMNLMGAFLGARGAHSLSGINKEVEGMTYDGEHVKRDWPFRRYLGRKIVDRIFSDWKSRSRVNKEVNEIKNRYQKGLI